MLLSMTDWLTFELEQKHPWQRLVLFMQKVRRDAVGCWSIEHRLFAGNATQAFFNVVGSILEHQRPRTVATVDPTTSAAAATAARLELPQAKRQHAELDALVRVDLDLPRTSTRSWRRARQRDVTVLLSV